MLSVCEVVIMWLKSMMVSSIIHTKTIALRQPLCCADIKKHFQTKNKLLHGNTYRRQKVIYNVF